MVASATPPTPKGKHESAHAHPAMSAHELRRVAVEALCDPRTIVKYLRGGSQPPLVRERVERALRACGHEHLVGYATQSAIVRAANPPSRASR